MLDRASTGNSLVNFAQQAEGAVLSCNADKEFIKQYLTPKEEIKCKWYSTNCK